MAAGTSVPAQQNSIAHSLRVLHLRAEPQLCRSLPDNAPHAPVEPFAAPGPYLLLGSHAPHTHKPPRSAAARPASCWGDAPGDARALEAWLGVTRSKYAGCKERRRGNPAGQRRSAPAEEGSQGASCGRCKWLPSTPLTAAESCLDQGIRRSGPPRAGGRARPRRRLGPLAAATPRAR